MNILDFDFAADRREQVKNDFRLPGSERAHALADADEIQSIYDAALTLFTALNKASVGLGLKCSDELAAHEMADAAIEALYHRIDNGIWDRLEAQDAFPKFTAPKGAA